MASTADGKLGAEKESRTRLNHSYVVFVSAFVMFVSFFSFPKLNFQSFVVLAGLEIPGFLVIFWSLHSLPTNETRKPKSE